MAISVASVVATCAVCGESLTAKGECLACLIRTALDESVAKSARPVSLVFGDFEIVRRGDGSFWELGHGGMGVTYLAVDKILRRKVALKGIEVPAAARTSHAVRERFLREARAAAALRHPNVAAVFQFGASPIGSHCYYAMELVEGETLETRVRRDGPVDAELALEIAIQVTRALTAAAAHGLIHRDLKPGNIMLTRGDGDTPEMEVKVIDFGLAKAIADAGASDITDAKNPASEMDLTHGEFVGTPNFASPEQFGSGPVDVRSDIYSLGATLWFALTGQTPFSGQSIEEIRRAQKLGALPVKQLKAARVPSQFKSLLKSMLAIEPAARPGVRELAARLRSCSLQPSGGRRSSVALAVVLVLILGASGFFVFRSLHNQNSALNTAATEKSVAVLPLENLSDDKGDAFFADGVHDELLSNLAKIKDLKVISRTSVMQFKSGIRRNLKEIARQLGVGNVVEGSVRRSGNHVRVSVQLIDARTDRHLWGENYDRTLADSLALQGDLATEIAAALGATLSPQEKAQVEAKPTNNAAAYDAYLRGRAFKTGVAWSDNADVAIRSYQQAVKLDPNFALAWAYLSCAQIGSYWEGIDHNPARLAPAKDSLDHALALDPNLPETHLALGYYRYYGQLDFTGALAEFQQAERDLPNNIDILQAITLIQRRLGHWDEAIEAARRAVELDPRNVVSSIVLAETYRCVRRFPEALATADRLLAFDPTNGDAIWAKASVFLATGDLNAVEPLLANPGTYPIMRGAVALFQRRYAAAIEILSKELGTESDPGMRNSERLLLGLSQQRARDVAAARATYQKAAQELQRKLEKIAPDRADLGLAYAGLGEAASAIAEGQKAMAMQPSSKDPYDGPAREEQMARIYSLLGDADHAIPILKRLLQIPYVLPITSGWLQLDPAWDQIRNDPRFQELAAEEAPLPEKSIAVLPFENLSKDDENAFFAGGVQDEILTSLAKVADLKVISRTSVMKYKSDLERNLREIAKALGVSHVVEGSVQHAGGRVRVNVQLIDARTDAHLWAEHYDRDFADVFAIQAEIAERIADQLRAKLSASEKAAIAERPTADLVAYAYYTKASEINIYDNWEDEEKSASQKVELLEKATQRDPNFALAYCALAKAEADLGNFELAKKAAEAALRVRPDLGEGHRELARYCYYIRDFDRAHDELIVARGRLPNDSETFRIAAEIDRIQNRWDASLANLQKAIELDPRNVEVAWHLERTYLRMRRYSELEQLLTKEAASDGKRTLGLTWCWLRSSWRRVIQLRLNLC
jgi:TolB-like protein/cytochrome c-type biogenesis protein CcmH/NrfG